MDRIGTVISISGGMDSATLLGSVRQRLDADKVIGVSFTYGSKHNSYERKCAEELAKHYGIKLIKISLSTAMKEFKSDLLKSGGDIPEGHYTDESMSATVVPCRNVIFTSFLAGIAESKGFNRVCLGIHSGDHAIYPDCRPAFFINMRKAVAAATDGKVSLEAPFLRTDKTGILQIGFGLNVPYEKTRTCYKDQPKSCGKCGSCVERLEAFANVGKKDPVDYE